MNNNTAKKIGLGLLAAGVLYFPISKLIKNYIAKRAGADEDSSTDGPASRYAASYFRNGSKRRMDGKSHHRALVKKHI